MMTEERKIAKNYRKRVRALLDVMLMHAEAIVGPGRKPTSEEMERFIDGFHHIANWMIDGARRLGFPVAYYPGPLTESELEDLEDRFIKRRITIIRCDNAG